MHEPFVLVKFICASSCFINYKRKNLCARLLPRSLSRTNFPDNVMKKPFHVKPSHLGKGEVHHFLANCITCSFSLWVRDAPYRYLPNHRASLEFEADSNLPVCRGSNWTKYTGYSGYCWTYFFDLGMVSFSVIDVFICFVSLPLSVFVQHAAVLKVRKYKLVFFLIEL